jgi:uncharacterized protein YggU (UPF0235/DUF167 family)
MKKSFQAVNSFVRQATNQGMSPELVKSVETNMKKGIANEQAIQALQKELKLNVKSVRMELGQIKTRD